jgi:hypothetical protein
MGAGTTRTIAVRARTGTTGRLEHSQQEIFWEIRPCGVMGLVLGSQIVLISSVTNRDLASGDNWNLFEAKTSLRTPGD